MEFIRVDWLHDNNDEPCSIFCEIDDNRLEIRKVEVYKDGKMGYATQDKEVNNTFLSYEPTPSLDQIANDPQFRARVITESEFQAIWEKALKD